MVDYLRPYDLVGARAEDPAGLRACDNDGFLALAPGLRIEDWDAPERVVQAPPHVRGGPYTELKLSPTPAGAVGGLIFRRRFSSGQPIWQVVRDALRADIYEVEAIGVRIRDRHSEGVLVEGIPRLRTEGENARQLLIQTADERERVSTGGGAIFEAASSGNGQSSGWTLLERDFERTIAAVEVPGDGVGYPARVDWSLVASIPRLKMLLTDGTLRIVYRRSCRVRLLDLFKLADVAGNSVGSRFAYFLAREIAHDLFSLRRQQRPRHWLRFAGSVLAFLGGLGGLSLLVSEALSALF